VHVVWRDDRDAEDGEIYYMLRDVIPETRITHFNGEVEPCYWLDSSRRNPDMAVTCDRVYVTF